MIGMRKKEKSDTICKLVVSCLSKTSYVLKLCGRFQQAPVNDSLTDVVAANQTILSQIIVIYHKIFGLSIRLLETFNSRPNGAHQIWTCGRKCFPISDSPNRAANLRGYSVNLSRLFGKYSFCPIKGIPLPSPPRLAVSRCRLQAVLSTQLF